MAPGEDALKPVFREVINDSKRRLQAVLDRLRIHIQGELPDFEEATQEQVEWPKQIKDRWTKLR
jgi:hypothetical protein